MGEFADDALEAVLRCEDAYFAYTHGQLSEMEALEAGVIDEFGTTYSRPKERTCRCCGKQGLRWGRHDGRWRLFDGDRLHKCPVRPLPEHQRRKAR